MSDRNEYGAFFVGFLAGGIIGAIAGLLLAPQTGNESRALIKEKSIELRNRAMQAAQEARDRAENLAREARTRAEEFSQLPGRERPSYASEKAEPSGTGGGRPTDEYAA